MRKTTIFYWPQGADYKHGYTNTIDSAICKLASSQESDPLFYQPATSASQNILTVKTYDIYQLPNIRRTHHPVQYQLSSLTSVHYCLVFIAQFRQIYDVKHRFSLKQVSRLIKYSYMFYKLYVLLNYLVKVWPQSSTQSSCSVNVGQIFASQLMLLYSPVTGDMYKVVTTGKSLQLTNTIYWICLTQWALHSVLKLAAPIFFIDAPKCSLKLAYSAYECAPAY